VTLSTHTQDDLPIARASLEGFRELSVRVLLTLGAHADGDVGTLPENARVERYVAHDPVLERAALMVSSAGHGAVMRALWHGVPLILVPWGRDQGGVAARAERLGAAVVIPRGQLTAELLETTARHLLQDPAIAARVRAVSRRMRTQDPVARACTMLEAI
jgi:MGT family glycosyltransferase